MATKTIKGQTVSAILKTAKIVRNEFGNQIIVVTTRDDHERLAMLGSTCGDYVLVLVNKTDVFERDVLLKMSNEDYKKFEKLQNNIDTYQ
jgi:hypothetical protein